ncbi:phosphoglycerate mutase [Methanococcoides vulcani]|uniref:2,3-bisphosphoglycerate-independent phosphoglycerate mutase n=1 Tax=Methanococcoides vulcani TaxID=1353158 RepID=A0A1H9Z4T3_9EURY|nr:cofactor-independent phosphoglycerate mutase [Methanococcoides vulcani]SES76487.1 phosphoglycerate mutase [Methanococcoides vulcani]
MKYIILIGDGMADFSLDELGGKTVLQKANTPNMDYMTRNGLAGLAINVPEGLPPGSDVANMSVMGYDPDVYYSGRAPLEAASMGIPLEKNDVAFRCNLITIDDGNIADHSAGHITSEEARELMETIDRELGTDELRFYPGISYRHLLVASNDLGAKADCTPPHDVIGGEMMDHMPKGEGSDVLCRLIEESMPILENHSVNEKRIKEGKSPANAIWFWGQGYAPSFRTFDELYGLTGSVISAVDLIKGLGIYAGLDIIDVPGATGYLDTNYVGKAEYAMASLNERDIVVVHVEAPDEAGHMGDLKAKLQAIEDFDEKVVGTVLRAAKEDDEDCMIVVLPDHPTPIVLRTHTSDPVPFLIYSTLENEVDSVEAFDEDSMKEGSLGVVRGCDIVQMLIDKAKQA